VSFGRPSLSTSFRPTLNSDLSMDAIDTCDAKCIGPIDTLRLDFKAPRLRNWSRETLRQLQALGCLFEPGRCAASPLIVTQEFYGGMLDDVHALLHLARRVAVDEGRALQWARADQRVLVKAGLGHRRFAPIARPDGIVLDGHLQLLELNLDSGLGGFFEVELLQRRLVELQAFSGTSYRVPHVLAALHGYLRDVMQWVDKPTCTLAVMVDKHLTPYNQSHAHLLCDSLNCGIQGMNARVVPTKALFREGDVMRDSLSSFDIVWRFGSMAHAPEQLRDCIAVQLETLATRTQLISSPSDIGVESKLSLALLSQIADEEDPSLSTQERQLVARSVPWTRILREGRTMRDGNLCDLTRFASSERASLVLKRAHSKSSQQVLIGMEMSDAAWKASLRKALVDPIPWVVQQNIQSEPLSFSYPHGEADFQTLSQSYSINPFIFANAEAAPFIRIERDPCNRRLAIANVGATATAGLVIARERCE